MKIHVLNTGFFKLDGGAMFGVVPKSIWNKLNPADEKNLCNWALRCLLIEDADRLILVDTGNGDKQDEKFFSHYHRSNTRSLESLLNNKGYTIGDVTDVLLTHLHFDHCGGAVSRVMDKLVPTFPNAVYWSNERHWKWATEPNEREKASFLKENMLPLYEHGVLKMVNLSSETKFSQNVSIRFANGHTDAMMLPFINFNGRTIVYVADLIPSIAHIPIPYVISYDMFPLTSMEEKKSFLKEAVEKNYVLFFEHDPFNECCEVGYTEKGIRSTRIFGLAEM